MGIGFKEWRQKVRLLEAINLLEEGEISVTEVALEIGYHSPSPLLTISNKYLKKVLSLT